MSDTAGQTPGTRRNGTDLKTAAEKAVAALERMAPIVQAEETPLPPSRPAIPPPPAEVETQVETELATEAPTEAPAELAAEPPVPEPSVPEPSVPEPAAELEAEPAAPETFREPAVKHLPSVIVAEDTLGTIRPVEIDDPPVIPMVSPRRIWIVRGAVAAAALLVASFAIRSTPTTDRAPALLGKAVHTPRVVVTGTAVEESGEPVPIESLPVEVATNPKKNVGVPGSAAFFAPETKPAGKGAGRTRIERVPFGSIPSREDEPMGVYPFLVRDKAPEDPAAGPLPPPPPAR